MSSNILVKRICEYCKKDFIAKKTSTRFCSHTCNSRNYKKKVRENKIKIAKQEYKKERLNLQTDIISIDIKPYLSIKEFCLLFNISDSTVRKLIKNGDIKAIRIGEKYVIRKNNTVF